MLSDGFPFCFRLADCAGRLRPAPGGRGRRAAPRRRGGPAVHRHDRCAAASGEPDAGGLPAFRLPPQRRPARALLGMARRHRADPAGFQLPERRSPVQRHVQRSEYEALGPDDAGHQQRSDERHSLPDEALDRRPGGARRGARGRPALRGGQVPSPVARALRLRRPRAARRDDPHPRGRRGTPPPDGAAGGGAGADGRRAARTSSRRRRRSTWPRTTSPICRRRSRRPPRS